ncbi:MAG: tail fiber domain-containing protein [Dokdonella sp.]
MSVAVAVLRVRSQRTAKRFDAYWSDVKPPILSARLAHREIAMVPKLLTLALLIAAANADAEPWTYSGTLSDGGTPANGRYDLRVTLLDATRSSPIGSPITFYSVPVHGGAFSVDVDFGSDLSNAPPMRLKTEVSKDKAPFVALGEPSRFDPQVALAGVCWDTSGNSGTSSTVNFLGTTDNQPLLMRASNLRIALFEANSTVSFYGDAPKITMGSAANENTAVGSTVSGGGATRNVSGTPDTTLINGAYNYFSTIGGGAGNTSYGQYGTISGGIANSVTGDFGAIGGGVSNASSGDHATISGGELGSAIGAYSTVAGGRQNRATAYGSSTNGGFGNFATGEGSTVGGGRFNCAGGDNSWAGGAYARVRPGNEAADNNCNIIGNSGDANGDEGTFVWADSLVGSSFSSTGSNQFLIRAAGGVAINTATKPNGTSPIDAELTITSNTARPDTNVEIFMYPRLSTFGYLMGVQGTQQSNGSYFITQTDGNTFSTKLQIDGNGTTFVQGGAVGNLSDVRLKKNIGPIPRPLDQLLALQGHVYEYIDPAKAMNAPGPRMGFVAQEVQTVLPNWVKPTGNDGFLAVTPIGFEALAVEAIRDLKAESDVRAESLAKIVDNLTDENRQLRARLSAIEARLRP